MREEGRKQSDQPPVPPSPSFIGEVGGVFSLFSMAGLVFITMPLGLQMDLGFVFTKTPPKATNGPQVLYCEPLGYVIGT
jgi:hypothetical protein